MKKSTKKQEKGKTARRKIRSYKAMTKKVNKKGLKRKTRTRTRRRTRTRKRYKGGADDDEAPFPLPELNTAAGVGFAVGAAGAAAASASLGGIVAGGAVGGKIAQDVYNAKLCNCPGCVSCKGPSLWTPFCPREKKCCKGRFLPLKISSDDMRMCGACLANYEERVRIENEKRAQLMKEQGDRRHKEGRRKAAAARAAAATALAEADEGLSPEYSPPPPSPPPDDTSESVIERHVNVGKGGHTPREVREIHPIGKGRRVRGV